MAGTVPLVGNFLKLLMRGGDTMGQMTLSRAFVVHMAILPALTVFFIAAHLVAFRQFGSVGPWKPKKPEKTGSFWPDQTFKDLLVVALILLGLICLSAFVRAPITGPADPLDNSYSPKPEWNFLFLYEALKAFKGSWEWMGTVVIPTLLVLLLFAVPFIDRNEKKNPFQRPVAMLSGFMFVAVILVMTFIGHYSNSGVNAPAPASAASASTNQAAAASASAASPATPEAAPSVSTNAPAAAVDCPRTDQSSCHTHSLRCHVRQHRLRFPRTHRRLLRVLRRRPIKLPHPQTPPPVRLSPRQRRRFSQHAPRTLRGNQVAVPPPTNQAAAPSRHLRRRSRGKVRSAITRQARHSIPNECRRRQCFGINEPKPHLPSRCAADLRGQLRPMSQPADPDLQLAGLPIRLRRSLGDQTAGLGQSERLVLQGGHALPGSPNHWRSPMRNG